MYKLDLEKEEMNQMSTFQHSLDHRQSKGIPERIYFCFIDYDQAVNCVDPTNCGKFLKRWEYQMTVPAFWENLYAGQEATVTTGHGTWTDSKLGKELCQDCTLSPCLFNLHAEYIMINAWLDEAQAGIKIGGRNISNLRYADDTILMVETEEELKSLLISVKEESEREESEKPSLKLKIQKTKWTTKKSYIFFCSSANEFSPEMPWSVSLSL